MLPPFITEQPGERSVHRDAVAIDDLHVLGDRKHHVTTRVGFREVEAQVGRFRLYGNNRYLYVIKMNIQNKIKHIFNSSLETKVGSLSLWATKQIL